MKPIKIFAVLVLVLGASTFAVYERQRMTALETHQRELAAAVGHAERTTQAERGAREALSHLALRGTPMEPRAPEVTPPAISGAPAESSPPSPPSHEPADYTAHLDSSFAAENVDATWGRSANAAVTSRLSAHGDRSLRSIDCRASMCRLVTDDLGREQAWQQIHLVIGNPGDEVWSGAYFSRVEEGVDGRPERVTYLFRNGASLPSP